MRRPLVRKIRQKADCRTFSEHLERRMALGLRRYRNSNRGGRGFSRVQKEMLDIVCSPDYRLMLKEAEAIIAIGKKAAELEDHERAAAVRAGIEPMLETLMDRLPVDMTQATEKQCMIAMQCAQLRAVTRPDLMQRGIEHLTRILGITKATDDEDEDTEKVAADLERLGKNVQAQLQKVRVDPGRDRGEGDEPEDEPGS